MRHGAAHVICESYPTVGFNYRMTDIQAVVGRDDESVRRHRAHAAPDRGRLCRPVGRRSGSRSASRSRIRVPASTARPKAFRTSTGRVHPSCRIFHSMSEPELLSVVGELSSRVLPVSRPESSYQKILRASALMGGTAL